MRIINFGSLNIDKVYQVEQFVRPGQTITAKDYAVAAGGKGLNQSLAAARAGAEVLHAGAIGAEGRFMADLLRESGADTTLIARGKHLAVLPPVRTGLSCSAAQTAA